MGEIIEFPRKPKEGLYVDEKSGKLKGSPHFRRAEDQDFGDRMERIKASLEKISSLMQELRKTTRED